MTNNFYDSRKNVAKKEKKKAEVTRTSALESMGIKEKTPNRVFSDQEVFAILKEYSALPNERGLRKKWLAEHDLTTAHIAIWRKAIREGKRVFS